MNIFTQTQDPFESWSLGSHLWDQPKDLSFMGSISTSTKLLGVKPGNEPAPDFHCMFT